MASTTTKSETIQSALNDANLNELAECLSRVKLGNVIAPVKVTFTGLASSATQDITTAAAKAAGAIAGITLGSGENLPAINGVHTVRVTAGAAAAGPRQMTDAGGTASATVAKLSDDGKTLTFEAAVTAFVITYMPRAAALSADYAPLS